MAAVIRFIINALVFIIVVSTVYIFGLFFHIIPLEYTPQVLFKEQFQATKMRLAESKAGLGKNLYNILNNLEKSYNPQPKQAEPASTTDGTATDQQAAPEQQEEKDPIARAREAAQQYQDAIDRQQKALDSY